MTIRRTFTALFSIVALFTLFAGILSAHHGRAGYDTKGQGITLRGVVTEYKWINPHVFLNWNVKNEKGETVEWTGEFSSPTTMISEGMGKTTFKPGECKLELKDNQVILKQGKTTAEAAVKVENGPNKFYSTSVGYTEGEVLKLGQPISFWVTSRFLVPARTPRSTLEYIGPNPNPWTTSRSTTSC